MGVVQRLPIRRGRQRSAARQVGNGFRNLFTDAQDDIRQDVDFVEKQGPFRKKHTAEKFAHSGAVLGSPTTEIGWVDRSAFGYCAEVFSVVAQCVQQGLQRQCQARAQRWNNSDRLVSLGYFPNSAQLQGFIKSHTEDIVGNLEMLNLHLEDIRLDSREPGAPILLNGRSTNGQMEPTPH